MTASPLLFFVRLDNGSARKPLKPFVGIMRIALKAGEEKDLLFTIAREFLMLADESGVFHEVPGQMTIEVENCEIQMTRR